MPELSRRHFLHHAGQTLAGMVCGAVLDCLLSSGRPQQFAAARFSLRHVSIFLAILVCATLAAADGAETMVVQAATVAEQTVPVRGGIAQWHGVDFPIFPRVSEVTSFGKGISYRIPTANRKESVALGSKIAAFYADKKFGTNAVPSGLKRRSNWWHREAGGKGPGRLDMRSRPAYAGIQSGPKFRGDFRGTFGGEKPCQNASNRKSSGWAIIPFDPNQPLTLYARCAIE